MDTRQHVHLAARVTPRERIAIRRAALDLGISASALVRHAVAAYLERLAREPRPAAPQRRPR